jgi:hypothetical protein
MFSIYDKSFGNICINTNNNDIDTLVKKMALSVLDDDDDDTIKDNGFNNPISPNSITRTPTSPHIVNKNNISNKVSNKEKTIPIVLNEALVKLNSVKKISDIIYLITDGIQNQKKYLNITSPCRQELENIVGAFRTNTGYRAYLYFSQNKKYPGFSICVSLINNHAYIKKYNPAYSVVEKQKSFIYEGILYMIKKEKCIEFENAIKEYCDKA